MLTEIIRILVSNNSDLYFSNVDDNLLESYIELDYDCIDKFANLSENQKVKIPMYLNEGEYCIYLKDLYRLINKNIIYNEFVEIIEAILN